MGPCKQDFGSLEEYKPVKPLDVLANEIGVPVASLVKLDANENLYGPIEEVSQFSHDMCVWYDPHRGAWRSRRCVAPYRLPTPSERAISCTFTRTPRKRICWR